MGTALLIYWRARPEFFCQWQKAADSSDRTLFSFIQSIEKRKLADDFPKMIAYDPKEEVGLYDDDKETFVRKLPAKVYQPSDGPIDAEDLLKGLRGEAALNCAAKRGDLAFIQNAIEDGVKPDFLYQ